MKIYLPNQRFEKFATLTQRIKTDTPLKTIYTIAVGLLLAASFTSCNESQELGAGFFPDESFDVALVDTLSFAVSSVIYDSIPTRNSGRLLVGYHEDAKLGKISAATYFQVSFQNEGAYYLDKAHTFYDSITLVLTYDGYSYYDTNQIQKFYVHEVLQTIEIPDEDTTLFNNTEIAYNPTPLGERSFFARPGRKGTLEIRLANRLGAAIFDLAIEESEILSTVTKFQEYLKGLVITPDIAQSGAILGFSPTAELRVHYRDNSELPVKQKTLVFPLNDGLYFNHIESNRSGVPLSKLQEFEIPLSSEQTGNEAFMQSGVGIAARIEIPYLKSMIELNNDFLISEAILEFYPTSYAGSANTPLPTTLTAYWVDEDNVPIASSFTAVLQTDNEFDRDTYYQIDLTTFIKTQLAITENNRNAILLTPSTDFRNGLNRIIIGDGKHKNKMKLKIYTISI